MAAGPQTSSCEYTSSLVARRPREAGEALARGDLQGAIEAKTRELLNHYLYRAAVEAQEAEEEIPGEDKEDSWQRRGGHREIARNDLRQTAWVVLASFGIGREDKPIAKLLEQIKRHEDPDVVASVEALINSATENGTGPYNEIPYNDFIEMTLTGDCPLGSRARGQEDGYRARNSTVIRS